MNFKIADVIRLIKVCGACGVMELTMGEVKVSFAERKSSVKIKECIEYHKRYDNIKTFCTNLNSCECPDGYTKFESGR